MTPWLFPTIAVTAGTIAAITDLRTGRIPNQLTLATVLAGVSLQLTFRGLAGALESVLGTVVCAAVPGVVYRASQGQGIGGGDIKLFAALGALLGPTQGLEAELSAFLLLGVYAVFRLAFVGKLLCTLLGALGVTAGFFVPSLRRRLAHRQPEHGMTTMRMAPAILLAVIAVIATPYVQRWAPWLG